MSIFTNVQQTMFKGFLILPLCTVTLISQKLTSDQIATLAKKNCDELATTILTPSNSMRKRLVQLQSQVDSDNQEIFLKCFKDFVTQRVQHHQHEAEKYYNNLCSDETIGGVAGTTIGCIVIYLMYSKCYSPWNKEFTQVKNLLKDNFNCSIREKSDLFGNTQRHTLYYDIPSSVSGWNRETALYLVHRLLALRKNLHYTAPMIGSLLLTCCVYGYYEGAHCWQLFKSYKQHKDYEEKYRFLLSLIDKELASLK